MPTLCFAGIHPSFEDDFVRIPINDGCIGNMSSPRSLQSLVMAFSDLRFRNFILDSLFDSFHSQELITQEVQLFLSEIVSVGLCRYQVAVLLDGQCNPFFSSGFEQRLGN